LPAQAELMMIAVFSLILGTAVAQTPVSSSGRGKNLAQERMGGQLGLGIGLGAPTGLTGAYWLSDWYSVGFQFGGDQGRFGHIKAGGDYRVHFRPFSIEADEVSIPLHVGAGFTLSKDTNENLGKLMLGPRAVVGVTVFVQGLPIDAFIEVAPTFYVYEEPTWSFDGQIGVRYYF